MKTPLQSFHLILIIGTTFISTLCYTQSVNKNDSLALVDLYNSTNGSGWPRHQNWLNGPVSTWFGVTVTGSRVTQLTLELDELTGSLPASIGNLTELTYLDFYHNNLTGNLPASIGNLTKLTQLHLEVNFFTGSIPSSFGNLVNVIYYYLNNNELSGSIPDSFGNLSSVVLLYLDDNQLSGSIPSSIGNLINLSGLYLYNNKLTGSIPSSIGNLKKLTSISMGNNMLSGSIPASIGNLSELTNLGLDNNKFSGNIPASLGNLDKLTYLSLNYNQLTGKIPPALRGMSSIAGLYLDNNLLIEDSNYVFPKTGKKPWHGDISHNHFTFNSLEAVAQKCPYVLYYPQAMISIHENGNTLSVSAGGTLSNNTYKWFKVGETTPVIIHADSTFQPAEPGSYFAEISNAVATGLILKTDTIVYSTPLAATKQKLSIYPNPVKNTLTIDGLDKNSINDLSIADFSGNILLHSTIKEQTIVHYNVSALKPGNYILYIIYNGKTNAVHFVKE
jgi:Leucine-rich repeat (LRR) protein